MNATRMIETKDQILQQFVRLQEEYEALASRIETKEEEAVRREDREVVAAANEHTVENIVTGLANLQLSFSTVIQDTSTQLSTEASRLEQLRRAIQVETTRLDQLKNVQIAADALDILKQEQAETTRAFDADSAQRLADLDQTVSEARVGWEKEQAGFVQSVADFDAALQRKRELEEADYSYTLARKLEQEADAFARRQRTVARNHAEEQETRDADWAEREAALSEQQAQYQSDLKRIEAFPAKLEQVKKTARESAIKKTAREAEIQASLRAEEVASQQKVLAYTVESHKGKVARNAAEIERLEGKLAALREQAQQLATKALTLQPRS